MDQLIVGLLTAAVVILSIIVSVLLIVVILLIVKLRQISKQISTITGSIAQITSAFTPAAVVKIITSFFKKK
jgi:preprotein translocase subunit SecG